MVGVAVGGMVAVVVGGAVGGVVAVVVGVTVVVGVVVVVVVAVGVGVAVGVAVVVVVAVMMTESSLTSDLLRTLRATLPGAVVLKHNERVVSGVPDFSVTLGGRTSWWEVKFGPRVISKGIQELTALRLASAGYCRYIFFEEKNDVKRTLILHPRNIGNHLAAKDDWSTGFDMRWLAERIREAHDLPR